MSEWKEYKLGDFIKVKHGYAFPGEHITPTETDKILVTPGNFHIGGGFKSDKYKFFDDNDFPQEYILHGGDIVVTMTDLSKDTDTLGYSAKIPFNSGKVFLHNQRIGLLQFKSDKVWPDYIYWLMRTREFQSYIVGSASGTSIMHTSPSRIESYECAFPSLDEQKRIAGVLSSLDDKIDLLNRENATLEALAETLFRHYFIENPNPEWKEGKLGDYVYETIGGEWGKEAPEEEYNMPVRCLRGADVADLNDGLAQRTPLRYIKQSKYDKIEPHSGDIILEISGGTDTCSTGRVAYINDSVRQLFDYPIVFSNFCRLLRVKEEHTYFVYYFFRYLHKQGEFFNLENGSSGIHNLNYKAALYDDLGWPVPTDEKLVIEFGEKVKPYFDKINTNKKQILSLSAQRDTLLPYLMSGDVKVGE